MSATAFSQIASSWNRMQRSCLGWQLARTDKGPGQELQMMIEKVRRVCKCGAKAWTKCLLAALAAALSHFSGCVQVLRWGGGGLEPRRALCAAALLHHFRLRGRAGDFQREEPQQLLRRPSKFKVFPSFCESSGERQYLPAQNLQQIRAAVEAARRRDGEDKDKRERCAFNGRRKEKGREKERNTERERG